MFEERGRHALTLIRVGARSIALPAPQEDDGVVSERTSEPQAWTASDWYHVGSAALAMKQLLVETVHSHHAVAPHDPTLTALEARLVEVLETLDQAVALQRKLQPGSADS